MEFLLGILVFNTLVLVVCCLQPLTVVASAHTHMYNRYTDAVGLLQFHKIWSSLCPIVGIKTMTTKPSSNHYNQRQKKSHIISESKVYHSREYTVQAEISGCLVFYAPELEVLQEKRDPFSFTLTIRHWCTRYTVAMVNCSN